MLKKIISLVIAINMLAVTVYADTTSTQATPGLVTKLPIARGYVDPNAATKNVVVNPATVTPDSAGLILSKYMSTILDNYADGSVSSFTLLEGAMSGMTKPLDKYSYYMKRSEADKFTTSLEGYMFFCGVYYTEKDGKFYVSAVEKDSNAAAQSITVGDQFLKVKGVDLGGLKEENIYNLLYNGNGKKETTTIQLMHNGTPTDYTLRNQSFNETVDLFDLYDSNLGLTAKQNTYFYISISQISSTTSDELAAAIKVLKERGITSVIIDLRNNPGGYVAIADKILNQLVPYGPLYSTVDNKGNKEVIASSLARAPFNNIVLLVDQNTASSAELISVGIKDRHQGIIVGTTTFGKGIAQQLINTPSGGVLRLTTRIILRNNGTTYNKIGIKPDVEVLEPMLASVKDQNVYKAFGTTYEANIQNIVKLSGFDTIGTFKASVGLKNDSTLDDATISALDNACAYINKNRDVQLEKAVEILKSKIIK